MLVVLAVAKVVLGGLFVDRGFTAQYYANDTWAAPVERSIEFREETFTRRDERLAFGSAGRPDLPLHFFNDLRFNFYLPSDPQRDQLAYSVEWNGFLHHDADSSPVTFYVAAGQGVSSELAIDGRQVIAPDGASPRTGSIRLETGWHAIRVRVAAPYGASRSFEAGEIVDDTTRPFDGDRILLTPAGSVRLASDAVLRWATHLVDAMVLSWLGLLVLIRVRTVWHDRRIGRLLWLGAVIEALLFASPHVGHVTLLSGGNDWLTYESFSRVIALGDWLLRGPTNNGPFYYQPLYP